MQLVDGHETSVGKVAKGELVRFTDNADATVWVRQHYDRSSKKYSFTAYDDCSREKFVSGKRKCFVGFTF
jgi:hypothetical protein